MEISFPNAITTSQYIMVLSSSNGKEFPAIFCCNFTGTPNFSRGNAYPLWVDCGSTWNTSPYGNRQFKLIITINGGIFTLGWRLIN